MKLGRLDEYGTARIIDRLGVELRVGGHGLIYMPTCSGVRLNEASLSLSLVLAGCSEPADDGEPVGTARSAVVNGAYDSANTYSGVVKLVGGASGSGVLISPYWVLTAAHTISSPGATIKVLCGPGGDQQCRPGEDVFHTAANSGQIAFRVAPGTPDSYDNCGVDLAAFRLDKPILRSTALPFHPPIRLANPPYRPADTQCFTPSNNFRWAGYGDPQVIPTGVAGVCPFNGGTVSSRRANSVLDEWYLAGEGQFFYERADSWDAGKQCEQYHGQSDGDSGGALIQPNRTGVNIGTALCGILSTSKRTEGSREIENCAVGLDRGAANGTWLVNQSAPSAIQPGLFAVVDAKGNFDGDCDNYRQACNYGACSLPSFLEDDADGDEIVAVCDNCPTIYNEVQATVGDDPDGDGFGERCDLCPGPVDYIPGPGGDCNFEISMALGFPSKTTAAEPLLSGPPTTVGEALAFDAAVNTFKNNFKPDVCDPVACPRQWLTPERDSLEGYFHDSMLPLIMVGYGQGYNCELQVFEISCRWSVSPNTLTIAPKTAENAQQIDSIVGQAVDTPVTVGMRWCKCDTRNTNSIAGRAECRVLDSVCPMTAQAYGSPGQWKQIRTEANAFPATDLGREFDTQLDAFGAHNHNKDVRWDYLDLWEQGVEEKDGDDDLIGWKLKGILMSKIVAVDGQPVSTHHLRFHSHAQTFQSGDAHIRIAKKRNDAILKQQLPNDLVRVLVPNRPDPYTFVGKLIGQESLVELTREGLAPVEDAPQTLVQALRGVEDGSAFYVPASEALGMLGSKTPPGKDYLRGATLDQTPQVVELLESAQLDTTPSTNTPPPCAPLCSPELTGNEALVLSGVLRRLVVVGGTSDGTPQGEPHPAAWLLNVDDNAWTELALEEGQRPAHVLGASFHAGNMGTYLVDTDADEVLLRRFVPHESMVSLATLPQGWAGYERSWLVVGEGGGLVFAASRVGKHEDSKVTVCHHSGQQNVSLRLPLNAAASHLNHGDELGDCEGSVGNDLGPHRAMVARFSLAPDGSVSFVGLKRLATPIVTAPIVTHRAIHLAVPASPMRLRVIRLSELTQPPPGQAPQIL